MRVLIVTSMPALFSIEQHSPEIEKMCYQVIGYPCVSTEEQAIETKEIELRSAGCNVIVQEHGSGASRARPRPALARPLR